MLRIATNRDLLEISLIEKESNITPWTLGMFEDSLKAQDEIWVLEKELDSENGVIFGFVVFSLKANECQIFNLAVKSFFRSQGYGRFLLQHALKIAKNKKINQAFLEVRESNRVAIALYHSLGFRECARRKNYYKGRVASSFESAIILSLNI